MFKDLNFKIAVIGALHELGYYVDEVEAIKEQNSDWDEFGKPIPEVLDFYKQLEIPAEYLGEIETLATDGGDLCYMNLFNSWDGEDGQFDITSIEGIEHLENLRNFEPISMIAEDGIDYSPLLKCKKLESICADFTNEESEQVIEQLESRGVEIA